MKTRITVRHVWLTWAALLVGALAVVVAGEDTSPLTGAGPGPVPQSGSEAAGTATSAARPSEADIALWAQALSSSTLWGARGPATVGTAAEPAVPEPTWAITGVYKAGDQFVAVLSWEALARPSLQVRRGEKLPDRSTVLSIESARVQIKGPSRRDPPRWLTVNRGVPATENPKNAHAQRP